VSGADQVEDLLRELAPQVLGALVRRYGQFDLCEDAVQEALLAAAVQWPQAGVPEHAAGLAGHRGLAADDRPGAGRERPPAPGGDGRGPLAGRRAGRPRRRRDLPRKPTTR
jgi:hypothetical protein